MKNRDIYTIPILIFLPIALFFISFLIGRYPVSPVEVVLTMLSPIFPDLEISTRITSIVFDIRLPRIIAAIVVGGSLSVAGAAFQGIFRNPLVSPDLLGVSKGAGFGASVAILLSFSNIFVQIFAFA